MGKDRKSERGEKRDKKALRKVKSKKKLKQRRNLDETSIGIGVSPETVLKNGALKHRRKKVLTKFKRRKVKEGKSSIDADDVDGIPTGNETEAILTEKVKKLGKAKKDQHVSKENKFVTSLGEVDTEKVDQILAVDEDCSRGMKKWLIEYKQNRPGLKDLQQRIDDFITAYEEQQEQERKEREARAAEGGWTVVVHHKGRKKTTDAESGVTVGSVAQAAVMDKMAKKKSKEVALDFYRFQKREAQRNELMMLRSKFEQDKKRIQQLRAARKFRPY